MEGLMSWRLETPGKRLTPPLYRCKKLRKSLQV
jgi:hypothetical protein